MYICSDEELPLESDLFNNFIEMEKEKSEGVMTIKVNGEMFENVIKQLEKHDNDENRKIIFHPSMITYDNRIAKSREQYRFRNRKNRTVYRARKILGYE